MSEAYEHSAAYDLKNWLWSELVRAGLMHPSNYESSEIAGQLIPVIPVQQDAVFNDQFGSAPYIVYDYVQDYIDPVTPTVSCEQIMFTVYAPIDDILFINKMRNFFRDLMGRRDWSAQDLNRFAPNSPYSYLTMYVVQTLPVEPTDENSRAGLEVIVEVKFVHNITSEATGTGRMYTFVSVSDAVSPTLTESGAP